MTPEPTETPKAGEDYFNSTELMTSDDTLFRQKTKNRFKNLATICQSIFKRLKIIKEDYQQLSTDSIEQCLDIEENKKAIVAIVEAFYALGFDNYFQSTDLPSGYRKADQITPDKNVTTRANNADDPNDTEYPPTWDGYKYDSVLFPNTGTKTASGEHFCSTCKFSQQLTSSTGLAGFECKYSKSEFYKYLTPQTTSRKCPYYSMADGPAMTNVEDTIMIVDLTAEPEVDNYEI